MTTFLLAYGDLVVISWLLIAIFEPGLTTLMVDALRIGWSEILTGRNHE
jgi:hypothetical protein